MSTGASSRDLRLDFLGLAGEIGLQVVLNASIRIVGFAVRIRVRIGVRRVTAAVVVRNSSSARLLTSRSSPLIFELKGSVSSFYVSLVVVGDSLRNQGRTIYRYLLDY